MRFVTDRCVECSTPARPDHISTEYTLINSKGVHEGTNFWFCSEDCYKAALEKYIPSRYHFGKRPFKDPEWKIFKEPLNELWTNDYYTEEEAKAIGQGWVDDWWKEYNKHHSSAQGQLRDRLLAEHRRACREQRERDEDELEKQRLKSETAFDKAYYKAWEEHKEILAHEAAQPETVDFDDLNLQPEKRVEHTWIIAGSGHGKSTLILSQLLHDLGNGPGSVPCIVIVDGKGTLVERVRQLRHFEFEEREDAQEFPDVYLNILDPLDLRPPALNMFAPSERKYTPAIQQQIENQTIDLLQYVFSASDFELTPKMKTPFSFAVRLLLSMKTANIHTFLDLLSDKGPIEQSVFKPHIDRLPPIPKSFFYTEFFNPKEYGETKQQIKTRIFRIIQNPAFEKMFSAHTNFDMFDALKSCDQVVLANAPKAVLGKEAAQLFGRYVIAMTMQAAFERITLPRKEWHPTYLIIDEVQDFVDEEKTPELLQQAREFNLGVVLAHQNIQGQLSEALQAAFAANTSIKFAGGTNYQDAAAMARAMGCEPEFIMKQRKTKTETRFACYIRGHDKPMSVVVPLSVNDEVNNLRMSENEYQKMLFYNRNWVSPKPRKPAPQAPAVVHDVKQPTKPEPTKMTISRPLDPEPDDDHSKPVKKW